MNEDKQLLGPLSVSILKGEAYPPCCAEWAKARTKGTDSENVSELIWDDGAGQPCMGGIATPILFCPWCGYDRRKPITSFVCPEHGRFRPTCVMYTIPAKAACPDCGTVVEDASGGIKTMELAGDLCTVDHPSPANPMCAHGCDYYDSCFPGTKPQGVAMYSAEGPEEHG